MEHPPHTHPTENAGVMYLEVLPGAARGGLGALLPEMTGSRRFQGLISAPSPVTVILSGPRVCWVKRS